MLKDFFVFISILAYLIAKFHSLRRLVAILLSLVLFSQSYGQSTPLRFNTYAERYYFIRELRGSVTPMEVPRRLDTLKQLADRASASGDDELAGELKLYYYANQVRLPNFNRDSAELNFKQMQAYAEDKQMPFLQIDAYEAAGDYHWEFNKRESAALENFLAAYKIYNKYSADIFPPKQEYTAALGGTYYRYEDYENAQKYFREALSVKESKVNSMFFTINNTLGMCYRKTKNYDSALYYFKRVYDSASQVTGASHIWMSISGGNVGVVYFRQGKYAEAKPLLEEDIRISTASNQIKNAAGAMGTRAAIYYFEKEYDKAEKMLSDAIKMSESRPFWPDYPLAEQLFTWAYKVYAAKNDMRRAYLYADSALMAKDSNIAISSTLNLAKANEKISHIQRKLDEERLNERIKLDELALSKKRVETAFFFVGIIVLLIVIIFIARERKRSENLLLNILPEKIAERLKKREHPIADYFEHASILFIDMAGFTLFSDGRNPKEVVTILNSIFTRFDGLAEKYGLEKIKTIGDCYMAVSGLPELNPRHAEAAAEMAMEIKREMGNYKAADGTPITFRMGLDCGPVVAGVIGRRKFIYDLWGDAVNTASRMETTGIAGEIHCSDRFKKQVEHKYQFKSRGTIEVKGKGLMETWLIV